MSRRVVVTGLGAVTPIGLNVEEFWNGIKEEKIGFTEIAKFDASEYKCKVAAEVKDFDAKNYLDFKVAKRMELFSQYAVVAAKEAMEDAQTIYYFQLGLNFLWPLLFFGLNWYLIAFLELVVLWISVAVMIRRFVDVSPLAAYLNVPYLIWLTFAAYLNLGVWWLNR